MNVVINAGPNGYGAYPHIGGTTRIQTGGTIAATAFDGIFVQALATQDPTTPNHTNDFDDIVVYGRRGIDLRSPTE
jgi:hypothetical protein